MERIKPILILINGKPGTGKTRLVEKLSQEMKIPYVSRDEIKELLFDDLGIKDSNWSQLLGGTSYSLFFMFFEKMMKCKVSFLIEGNFNPNIHKDKFKKYIDKYEYDVIEIFLEAESNVLFKRFTNRWASGERHRGHADDERFDEFKSKFHLELLPLGLSENLIKIDTTNFDNIDLNLLISNLNSKQGIK